MRRLERELITHYEAMVSKVVATLTFENYEAAVAIASAADLVRGYEEVKTRNLHRYVMRLNELDVDTSSLSL